MDRAKKALDTEKEKTADERDDALVAQLEQQYKTALIENETWLPSGTGRKVVNALNAAVGGNLSAGAAQFVQMGVANYLQQEGATLLGEWTHEGKLTEGSPLHAALHGAVGCLGAAAGGGDCGAGGMGAATSSLLTHLFTDQPDETFAEKETKRDIIVGLTTAMALGTNLDPGTALNSAVSSVDNNYLTQSQLDDWIEAAKTCTPGAECDALNKSYLQLDRAQQGQLIVDCASDYAACRQKYSFIFGENDETWDRIKAAREFISSSVLLNIGLSQNDAEGAVFSASLAQGLKERFNLDPDKVQLALDIAMAMTSGMRGGAQRGSASGHQTHVQASSGNTNTGRHTEQPSSHTTGNVATSSGDVNKPHTGDNASSVGQNETANHSGVDGSAGVTKGAKRGPKTDPNAPHNKKIREIGDQVEADGGTVIAGGGRLPEQLIRTDGGNKSGRRPDVLYQDCNGNLCGVNVGKTKADGAPIKREQQALDDLNGAGLPTRFERYD